MKQLLSALFMLVLVAAQPALSSSASNDRTSVILRASDEDARRTSQSSPTQASSSETPVIAAHPCLPQQSQSIANGKSTFRVDCAYCHGINADGGFRAPSLISGHPNHGSTDDAMLNNILHGIPGTAMPANDIEESEARDVIAYLRSLQKPASVPVTGNPEAGRKLFFGEAYCSRCHMIDGQGGRLGPDLSRIGAMRPRDYLIESIRNPDAIIAERFVATDFGVNPPTYELVTVTTSQGSKFSGIILNEDSFSLQFMDDHEKIHSWSKSDIPSIVHEKRSPMPAYGNQQLSGSQLDDLVAYLTSLTGAPK